MHHLEDFPLRGVIAKDSEARYGVLLGPLGLLAYSLEHHISSIHPCINESRYNHISPTGGGNPLTLGIPCLSVRTILNQECTALDMTGIGSNLIDGYMAMVYT